MINTENLEKAFAALDLNGDDKISGAEIKYAFTHGNMSDVTKRELKLEDKFWEELINEIDTNEDGYIDFEEFQAHMKKLVEPLRDPDSEDSEDDAEE